MHIKTEEFLQIQSSLSTRFAWCPCCRRRVQMTTADEAAQLARVSPRTIYRLADTGKLHFTETPGALLLVCLDSLLGCLAALERMPSSEGG